MEIVCIEEGAGVFIAGDEQTSFTSGDVVMTGRRLCHQYKLDPVYSGEMRDRVKVSVVRFLPDFWGETFLNLHENASLKVLIGNADRGIMPDEVTCETIKALMIRMRTAENTGKIILLLDMLFRMSISKGLRFLSSGKDSLHPGETDKLDRVLQFSGENFLRKIGLEEVAGVAYISPHSFCRWFKVRTKKTFSRYLIELRVRHACRLLTEGRLNAKNICADSGFNTFSNFHKCFKEVMGKSPMEYQREVRGLR